jgi:hypothetical protein
LISDRLLLRAAGLVLVFAAGCQPREPTPQGMRYAPVARPLAEVADERIVEASGIAASRRHADFYYVHNDSGDVARVFLVDRSGDTWLTVRLKGTVALDFEDIAISPGAQPGSYDVCVADIGDNSARRPQVVVYRFPEPELEESPGGVVEVEPSVHPLRYANGPRDAEAFVVHPDSGDAYILSKRDDGRSEVYKLEAPWPVDELAVVPLARTIELPPAPITARIITAADISPDGQLLVARCYVDGWEWQLPTDGGDGGFERIFDTRPERLRLAAEPQAEAICYAADGRSILTISEGSHPNLFELQPAADD